MPLHNVGFFFEHILRLLTKRSTQKSRYRTCVQHGTDIFIFKLLSVGQREISDPQINFLTAGSMTDVYEMSEPRRQAKAAAEEFVFSTFTVKATL